MRRLMPARTSTCHTKRKHNQTDLFGAGPTTLTDPLRRGHPSLASCHILVTPRSAFQKIGFLLLKRRPYSGVQDVINATRHARITNPAEARPIPTTPQLPPQDHAARRPPPAAPADNTTIPTRTPPHAPHPLGTAALRANTPTRHHPVSAAPNPATTPHADPPAHRHQAPHLTGK
jgi:hypothetical protein